MEILDWTMKRRLKVICHTARFPLFVIFQTNSSGRRVQLSHETELWYTYSFLCVSKGFPCDEIENASDESSVSVAWLSFLMVFSNIVSRGEANQCKAKGIWSHYNRN